MLGREPTVGRRRGWYRIMTPITARLDAIEAALASLQQVTTKILDAGGTDVELDGKLNQILEKVDDLRETMEEFLEQMEDALYRMNRDREDDDP